MRSSEAFTEFSVFEVRSLTSTESGEVDERDAASSAFLAASASRTRWISFVFEIGWLSRAPSIFTSCSLARTGFLLNRLRQARFDHFSETQPSGRSHGGRQLLLGHLCQRRAGLIAIRPEPPAFSGIPRGFQELPDQKSLELRRGLGNVLRSILEGPARGGVEVRHCTYEGYIARTHAGHSVIPSLQYVNIGIESPRRFQILQNRDNVPRRRTNRHQSSDQVVHAGAFFQFHILRLILFHPDAHLGHDGRLRARSAERSRLRNRVRGLHLDRQIPVQDGYRRDAYVVAEHHS